MAENTKPKRSKPTKRKSAFGSWLAYLSPSIFSWPAGGVFFYESLSAAYAARHINGWLLHLARELAGLAWHRPSVLAAGWRPSY